MKVFSYLCSTYTSSTYVSDRDVRISPKPPEHSALDQAAKFEVKLCCFHNVNEMLYYRRFLIVA